MGKTIEEPVMAEAAHHSEGVTVHFRTRSVSVTVDMTYEEWGMFVTCRALGLDGAKVHFRDTE